MEETKSQDCDSIDCESVSKESFYEEPIKVNNPHFEFPFSKDRKEVCFYCDKEEDQVNLFFPNPCYCLKAMNIHIDCFHDYKKKYDNVCYKCRTIYKDLSNKEETNKIEELFLEKVTQMQKREEEFEEKKNAFWDMIEEKYPEYTFLRKYYENLEEKHRRLSRNCAMIMKKYEKSDCLLEENYQGHLSKWK